MADSEKQFLVIDENGAGHLKVRQTPDGPLDHGLMGGAHAALMSSKRFRGKPYEGPDKEKAIAKLRRLYEDEGMPWPEATGTEKASDLSLNRIQEIVNAAVWKKFPQPKNGPWTTYVREVYPGYVVIEKDGRLLRMDFTITDGVAKLGEPQAVEPSYISAREFGPPVLLDRLPKPLRATDTSETFEIPLMPAGKWQRFTITAKHLEEMEKNFAAQANGMLPIDYEHAMELVGDEPGLAQGGPIPAAGWIHKIRKADFSSIKSSLKEALIATVEFTNRALEMIRAGEYRFISPAWTFESADRLSGDPRGARLLSAGLTNKPFFTELPPLKASEFGTGNSGTSSEPQRLNPESRHGGTNVEKLTARKTSNGLEILKGTEVIGTLELEQEVDETPILARFTESIGAKGKTEEEVKKLVENGVKFTGREAQDAAFKLLATECVKDGKLNRESLKVLAREGRATVEQFFTFEDAWGKVDTAVKAGKVLPKSREHALRVALSDAPAFDALMADAKAIVPVVVTGLAGGGRPDLIGERPKNVSAGKEVVNADRVARIHALQEESAKTGKKLTYLEAHAIVLAQEQAAGIDGDGQAA